MLSEKIAYIKGVADALKIEEKSDEGKVLKLIVELLDDMAVTVDDLADELDVMTDVIDGINDDLLEIEDDLYDSESDDCDCSCDCKNYDEGYDDDYNFEDDEEYTCVCPNCKNQIFFDESIFNKGGIQCPECGEELEFDNDEFFDDEPEDVGFDDDDAVYKCTCPTCGKVMTIDESIIESGGIECPSCGETLEFNYDEFEQSEE